MLLLSDLPPLSLYVHIPWCVQKCPYCDFNSHRQPAALDENAYIDALLIDLQQELPHIWGRSVDTVFIGGGTPSLFQAASINRLLSGIRALIKLNPEAEITLEANPGTFEIEKFQGFKEAGINRLSVGIQSFDDNKLRALGRIHSAAEARTALHTATHIFARVNADLMYALPQQTPAQAVQDIEIAADCGVSHISAYHLTLEPNTAFAHRPPQGLPVDDAAQDIEEAVHNALFKKGFQAYETSAFAKHPNQRARHNLNYWQFGDYIGIGAGAHGKISHHNRIERTVRSRHPQDYLRAMHGNPADAVVRRDIAKADLAGEFMMNALRLHEGVPSAWLPERTGVSVAAVARAIQTAQQKGLLDGDPRFFRATELGRRFLNDLIGLFL
ncbi:radical SAM family heme chaperone HemW [Conchiformibius kuhniae]|uniref:Heme chaperone HemW n=1 Tax=Conchiformibius kuhniae TaxID=211502 RepID=A0A8T9MVN8_9NEIS|nr:radical SAM family heme chaperone HemW [Conchiformibius kuhniae]UOP05241.1 radical SAM family heme chaperone HemW [Conchiformibius kuhniae]